MRVMNSFFLFLLCTCALAQEKKQTTKAETSKESFYPQQEFTPNDAPKKSNKVTYDAREKFYARQERNKKNREKAYPKKDYSQAPYFGHKRPPKIRPVGKRKLCKVCGMTH